jgi:pantothenate kinase
MIMDIPPGCLERVTRLIASGKRNILGIVAPPGAGKSTLVEALFARFPDAIQIVPMDGFHLANSELVRLGRAQRKGACDTFDAAGFVSLLHRIKTQARTETIYAPVFRRDLEEPIAGAIAVEPNTPLVITEGNYLLLEEGSWAQVRNVVDEVWYLDVSDAVRQDWLLQRHMRFGRTRTQALDWIRQTDEPNAVRIAQTRHRADVVVAWDETMAKPKI